MSIKLLKQMQEMPSGKEFHKKFGLPKAIQNHPYKSKERALDTLKGTKNSIRQTRYESMDFLRKLADKENSGVRNIEKRFGSFEDRLRKFSKK